MVTSDALNRGFVFIEAWGERTLEIYRHCRSRREREQIICGTLYTALTFAVQHPELAREIVDEAGCRLEDSADYAAQANSSNLSEVWQAFRARREPPE